MTMTVERNLKDFEFCGNAALVAEKLTTEELNTIEETLEQIIGYGNELWSETPVNDFLAFDFEYWCEDYIGITYEELMARE